MERRPPGLHKNRHISFNCMWIALENPLFPRNGSANSHWIRTWLTQAGRAALLILLRLPIAHCQKLVGISCESTVLYILILMGIAIDVFQTLHYVLEMM